MLLSTITIINVNNIILNGINVAVMSVMLRYSKDALISVVIRI